MQPPEDGAGGLLTAFLLGGVSLRWKATVDVEDVRQSEVLVGLRGGV